LGVDLLKSPEILIETESVLVRTMTLTPLEVAPVHFHTDVAEHIVCLNGKISVCINLMETETFLAPGQSVSIPAGIYHQIKNMADITSQYLLTQSGGKYDFCELPA
jgi:quercetin dioxygenase-like cupin family protein